MIKRLCAFAVTLLISLAIVAVPARGAGDISPAAEEGFAQISQCLQSHSDMAVLLVVDESGSLADTDPNNKRAVLLANLVRALGRQAGQPTASGDRRIDLAVSTFSLDYRPLVPWTQLDPASSETIARHMEQQLPGLNQGQGTDHRNALIGARNQMAKNASQSGTAQPPCQVTIMFTDGVLDLGDESAEQGATDQLCRPNGIVDGLRRDGVNLITVMLFDPRVAAANPGRYRHGRELLQASAEGRGGARTCGTVPIPAEQARGAYLEGGVDKLAALFASAFALSQGATQIDRNGSPVTIEIDPGIASFTVVGLAPQGIVLDGPGGQKFDIPKDNPAGSGATAVWDFDTVTVAVPVQDGMQGEWVITRPGQSDPVSVFLNTGLGLTLADTPLVTGEKASISGRVVRPGSDEPVDLSIYKSADMTANVVGASADALNLESDGTFTGTVTPEGNGSRVQLEVTLNLTTQSGQQLQPVAGRFSLPVTLPKEFPQVSPAVLTLTPLEGADGRADGSLTVTGSAEGATKVCSNPVEWSAADDPTRYTTTQTQGCFDLATGEKRTVDVSVTTSSPVDERVGGDLPLTMTSANGTERELIVPVTFTATRPVNEAVRYGVVAVLAFIAIALPLLLLYLVNRRLARFQVLEGSRFASLPVTISRSGIWARVPVGSGAGGAPSARFEIPPQSLRLVPPTDSPPRQIAGPDGSTLRTRMPRFLLGAPSAEVVAAAGHRVLSNQQPFVNGDGESAPVTIGLGDVWYVSVEDTALASGDPDQGIHATVNAYIPPSGAGETVGGVSDKIRQFTHYGTILDRLRGAAVTSAAPTGSQVGGLGSPAGVPAPARPDSGGPTGPSRPGSSSPRPTSGRPSGPTGPKTNGPAGPASPSRPTTGPASPSGPSGPGPSGPARPGGGNRPSGPGPGGSGNPPPRPPGPSGPSGPSGPRGPHGPNR